MLVDEDWVVDVLHDDVSVANVRHIRLERGSPALDPQPIVGAIEHTVLDPDVAHVELIGVLPEAPDADPVARSAPDTVYVDLTAPRAERDAVIPSGDDRVGDLDVFRVAEVDPISVGALRRGDDAEALELDVGAPQHVHVEVLAV